MKDDKKKPFPPKREATDIPDNTAQNELPADSVPNQPEDNRPDVGNATGITAESPEK